MCTHAHAQARNTHTHTHYTTHTTLAYTQPHHTTNTHTPHRVLWRISFLPIVLTYYPNLLKFVLM